MLTSIVSAAAILAVLIIVHELGHFAMAKRLGVRVMRFAIGYPPRIWGIRRGETDYAVCAVPFGGYVRMLGEEVGEEPRNDELHAYVKELALDLLEAARNHGWSCASKDTDTNILALSKVLAGKGGDGRAAAGAMTVSEHDAVPATETYSRRRPAEVLGRDMKADEADVVADVCERNSIAEAQSHLAAHPTPALTESFRQRSFPTQKLWKRFAIVSAGPVANLIFAPLLMAFAYMWGVPSVLPIVGEVSQGLPAAAAGLQSGDRIVAINGKQVESWNEFSMTVKSGDGAPIQLETERGSQHQLLTIKPKRQEEPTPYGNKVPTWIIGVKARGDEVIKRYGPLGAMVKGVSDSVRTSAMLVVGIWEIINGSTPVRQALGGPIMIAQLAGKEAHEGLSAVLQFTVMLSLELGIINLLPVPLLDGGHLLFFAFEGARGQPLKLRTREMALQVGLLVLVALMAFVIFNDISRIVQG